ncbi:MAG: hypothetical protein ABI441_17670 [Flavobacterium sp.]
MKKILILLLIAIFLQSCRTNLYLKSYEPINVFLETQKLDRGRTYILQKEKEDNKQALRIFNRGQGPKHIIDSTDIIDYTDGMFVEKHWKKMYKKYAQDTLKKYWKKEDFPKYNFVLENEKGLLKYDFLLKYINSTIDELIIISEPMYYRNRKYIVFYYERSHFDNSRSSQVVIMKKEKNKWIVIKVFGDYIYS